MNNTIFVTIMVFLASLCIFNKNTIEGFMGVSGTNARHAYLPQSYKNQMSIKNFKPHGSTQTENIRQLETFNYNPKTVRNNVNKIDKQFKMIENFQRKNNMVRNKSYNKNSSPRLPKSNLSETYIPNRKDYELSRGVGVSSVTPQGYRNGAKPSFGANMLRGEIFEPYVQISANVAPGRGRKSNPVGELLRPMSINTESQPGTKFTGTDKMFQNSKNSNQQYVPMANRRGDHAGLSRQQQQQNITVAPQKYGRNTLLPTKQQYGRKTLLPTN